MIFISIVLYKVCMLGGIPNVDESKCLCHENENKYYNIYLIMAKIVVI